MPLQHQVPVFLQPELEAAVQPWLGGSPALSSVYFLILQVFLGLGVGKGQSQPPLHTPLAVVPSAQQKRLTLDLKQYLSAQQK